MRGVVAERERGRSVVDPVGIRAEKPHAGAARQLRNVGLPLKALRSAGFRKADGADDRAAHAPLRARADRLDGLLRRYHQHRAVDGIGQFGRGAKARETFDFATRRVDGKNAPRKAALDQVPDDRMPDFSRRA